jgi:PAS domain S-box-containing protein
LADAASPIRNNATSRALRGALVASIIVPATLFSIIAWQSHNEIERGAEEKARRTAVLLREHALKVLETCELAILQIDGRIRGLDWNTIRGSDEVYNFLLTLDESLNQISIFTLMDGAGHIRNDSKAFPVLEEIDESDRDFFTALAERDVGTVISHVYTSRLTGVRSFSIARRRTASNGRFDGVVVATVDEEYFSRFYRPILESRGDAVALILGDGTVLLRQPAIPAVLGPQSGFMQAIAGGASEGVYTAFSGVDGTKRIYGFAKAGQYPLYVTFGLEERAVLGPWFENLRNYGIFVIAASLALIGISWVSLRRAQELQTSEERYRTLYASTPVPMHTLDADANILSVSDHWVDFLGYSREEAIGHPIFEFQTKKSADEFHAKLWPRTLAGEPVTHIEREFIRKDGEVVVVLVSARSELDAEGHLARVHTVLVDITPRKRAEHELRREKELSGFLLKSSTEGIAGIDRSFRVTLWNPAMSGVAGFAPHEALGRELFELFPKMRGTSVETALRGALEGRRTEMSDRSYTVPSTGERGYYEARYAPIYGEEGNIIGAVAFIHDTTERRRMEETLRQSQKMEAVGQLTGGIAHDFNNLLTVIIGNLQLIGNSLAADAKARRQLAAAQRAADRGARLTSQLLAFSRRQNLRPEVRDMNELIRDFRSLTQRAAGDAIELRFLLHPGLWHARVDPAQFESAVLNLVVNARDAIAKNGAITIETVNSAIAPDNGLGIPPGDYVRISVADTGSGMPPGVLARAFEPFFTTKDVGKGTGLGLSMVYGFVQQSGGEMRIDSEPGVGTRVYLYLPRSREKPANLAIAEVETGLVRQSGTILVVDDDPDVRDAVAAILIELGYEVVTASNGQEALGALRGTRHIDLLFSDIIMTGGMSGIELAHLARREFPRVRVVLTSGYAFRDPESMAAAAEFVVIAKPYSRDELGEVMRQAFLAPLPTEQASPSDVAS